MLEYLIAGITIGTTFSLLPSPLLALTISETLRYGRREGIVLAFTPIFTDVPFIIISLLVMSSLSGMNGALAAISCIGALFLAWLGIKGLRSKGITIDPNVDKPKNLRKGIITNFLNPNPYIFWFTVGAPMIISCRKINRYYPIVYLAGFFICLIGSRVILAIIIERFRMLLSGRGYFIVSKLLALTLIAFAVKLAVQGFRLLR
jgi:threonine/homoserine/homoserine lactone efflux protein